jgi:hypothetical protein
MILQQFIAFCQHGFLQVWQPDIPGNTHSLYYITQTVILYISFIVSYSLLFRIVLSVFSAVDDFLMA